MASHFLQQNLYWILPLGLLDLTLKGIALWFAAKHKEKGWFIALFVINTLGILPAVYLIFFREKKR